MNCKLLMFPAPFHPTGSHQKEMKFPQNQAAHLLVAKALRLAQTKDSSEERSNMTQVEANSGN